MIVQPVKCIVPATAQPIKTLETFLCGEFQVLFHGYIYVFAVLKLFTFCKVKQMKIK